jgi:hypothetical protein
MKNTIYYCRMSSGIIHRVEFATSAGEAIYQALFAHKGETVKECYQGPEMQDARYPKGRINFEVPAHTALPIDAKKPTNRKPKDQTGVMGFIDEQIEGVNP